MDTAYYEELAGRLYGLLIGLDDRIGNEQARLFCHFTDVGEYGLALEEIARHARAGCDRHHRAGARRRARPGRPDEPGGQPRPSRTGSVPGHRQPRAPLRVTAGAG